MKGVYGIWKNCPWMSVPQIVDGYIPWRKIRWEGLQDLTHLVVQGFKQIKGDSYDETFCPAVNFSVI